MNQFFRNIYYEVKWLLEELVILVKHPTRKATYRDIRYHFGKILDHIIFHPWYCLKRGIRNLWIWFPIIWQNDSWDHYYLTRMMDKQLEEMEVFFLSDIACSTRANRDGKRIKWIRRLMQMWKDEHYTMLAYDEYRKQFPCQGDIFRESKPHTVDEFGIVTSFICESMKDDETTVFRKLNDDGRRKDEKVFKLWLKNLGHIRSFWD